MGEPGKNPEQMKERFAKHQAELHDTLKITAAQEPAWKTFIQSVTPKAMPQREDFKELDKLTTPQRMEKMLENERASSGIAGSSGCYQDFHATLTPEQQKILMKAIVACSTKCRATWRGKCINAVMLPA
jgi:hypothetical protein